jgi:nickel transport system ATP-binding protein
LTGSTLAIDGISVETFRDGSPLTLVDNVSLTLSAGEVLALVGASGSGKSLTCAAALDVLPSGTRMTSGTVAIDGSVLPRASLRARHVATIMQNPRSAFNPVRTMRDHAWESLRALGVARAEGDRRIRQAMKDCGLDEPEQVLRLHPFEMSGGMLQRMMIALALSSGAPFLLADEPTTDLDLIVQREILDLLDDLRSKRRLGILLVTHDMGVVARLADRVAVMDGGRIVETASVTSAFSSPGHATTRRLVDAHLSLYDRSRVAA